MSFWHKQAPVPLLMLCPTPVISRVPEQSEFVTATGKLDELYANPIPAKSRTAVIIANLLIISIRGFSIFLPCGYLNEFLVFIDN